LGFLFKTVRQIFIKEAFKWYYARRFSMPLSDKLQYCIVWFVYILLLYYILIFLNIPLLLLFPLNGASVPIDMLLGIGEVFLLNSLFYKCILKKHFEKNINKYALLYWHCKQIFEKHNINKNICIPKAKCIWNKLDVNKVPWVYFELMYREFILHTFGLIGIIYALYNIDYEDHPKQLIERFVIIAVHDVVASFKRIYN